MLEKTAVDATVKTVQAAEKTAEGMIRKAWSIMEAASEKRTPSQYLSDQAIRSIQGKE